MLIEDKINAFILSHSEPKLSEIQILYRYVDETWPDIKKWFLDGKDENGKIVSNPSIGFGSYFIKYANGNSKEFYKIGISTNKSGISIYILGLNDKKFLNNTYGKSIGKAHISGYCIKFKTMEDINFNILKEALKYGIEANQ
jgi:hypothetical protein